MSCGGGTCRRQGAEVFSSQSHHDDNDDEEEPELCRKLELAPSQLKYQRLDGVVQVIAGYSGGLQPNPLYDDVLDHSEALWIEYDPSQVSLEDLLVAWTKMHKPEKPVARQYRSAVWFLNQDQRIAANKVVSEWTERHKEKLGDSSAVLYTTVEPATDFYQAESYHQDYYIRTGQARFVK